MYLGTHLHEALAWLYGEFGGIRDSIELLRWFKNRLVETLPSSAKPDTVELLYETGRKALLFHYEAVYRNERTRTIAIEKPVRLNLGKVVTFVGRVDRIAFDPSGTIEVIDYKTSLPRGTSRPRIPHSLQIAAYSAAVLSELKMPSVIARRIILATGEEERFAFMAADMRQITLSLRRWISRLAGSRDFPLKPGAHCSYCQFNLTCAEGSRYPAARGAFTL